MTSEGNSHPSSSIFSQKIFFSLYFREWNFLSLRLKDFLYFLKKIFSYIFGNNIFKKTFYILGGNFLNSKNEKKHSNFFLYFRNWNFLAPENLIKLFYALNKTPLQETRCLSNHYFFLASQTSSFLIHFL